MNRMTNTLPEKAQTSTLTTQQRQLHLGGGALATGRFECSRLLLVRRGYVWVTQEGRTEDFWLSAGDSLIVNAGRLLVIEAATASDISLENSAPVTLPLWVHTRCLMTRLALQRGFARLGQYAARQMRH